MRRLLTESRRARDFETKELAPVHQDCLLARAAPIGNFPDKDARWQRLRLQRLASSRSLFGS